MMSPCSSRKASIRACSRVTRVGGQHCGNRAVNIFSLASRRLCGLGRTPHPFARGSSRDIALSPERATGHRFAVSAWSGSRNGGHENRNPKEPARTLAGGARGRRAARAQSGAGGRARVDAYERRQDARRAARKGRRQGALHQGAGARAARRARGHCGALDEGRPGRASAGAAPAGHHGARRPARCARFDTLRRTRRAAGRRVGRHVEPAPQVPARRASAGSAHREPARRCRHPSEAARSGRLRPRSCSPSPASSAAGMARG